MGINFQLRITARRYDSFRSELLPSDALGETLYYEKGGIPWQTAKKAGF